MHNPNSPWNLAMSAFKHCSALSIICWCLASYFGVTFFKHFPNCSWRPLHIRALSIILWCDVL